MAYCCAGRDSVCKVAMIPMMCGCQLVMRSNGGRTRIWSVFWKHTRRTFTKFIFRSVGGKIKGCCITQLPVLHPFSSHCPLEDVQLQRRGLLGWFEQPWLVSAVVGYVKWCLAGNRSSFSVFAAAIMLGNRLMP